MAFTIYFLGTGDGPDKHQALMNILYHNTQNDCMIFAGAGTGMEGEPVGVKMAGPEQTHRVGQTWRGAMGRGLNKFFGSAIHKNIYHAFEGIRGHTFIPCLVLVGHSRGAVTALKLANELAKVPNSVGEVRMILFDPVPGMSGNSKLTRQFGQWADTNLASNVTNLVEFICLHDKRDLTFNPIIHSPETRNRIVRRIFVPGNHTDMTEEKADTRAPGIWHSALARIVRNVTERYLLHWGVPLTNTYGLSDIQMLVLYEDVWETMDHYLRKLRKVNQPLNWQRDYTMVTRSGARIGMKMHLHDTELWVGKHHKHLFNRCYRFLGPDVKDQVMCDSTNQNVIQVLQGQCDHLLNHVPRLYKRLLAATGYRIAHSNSFVDPNQVRVLGNGASQINSTPDAQWD